MKVPKKISYSEDVDILMIQLSNKKVDDAYETDWMIVHIDKNREPVVLEIFHGMQYLKELNSNLSGNIQKEIFNPPNVAITHQLRR